MVLLAASLTLSCEKKDAQEPEEIPSVPGKVRISPTLVKATETQFEVGDAIGVTITLPTTGYVRNVRLVYDGTEFSGDLEWYDGTSSCTIDAYYPYYALYKPFSVKADQSNGLSESDYITGFLSNVKPTDKPVAMSFYHRMSRLEIDITNNSGKELAGLKIGGLRPDLNLTQDPVEITPFSREGKYYALVPPQRAKLVLGFTLDGEERTATVPAAFYNQGMQHTVTLTLDPETGAYAALTGEIDGWEDHGVVYPSPDDFYSILKERYLASGYGASVSFFSRCYFFMSELRADNVCQSGFSEDPFTLYLRYEDTDRAPQVWPIMDRMIAAANPIIKAASAWDAQSSHSLGEAYFFRAFSYFTQVTFYARPYALGKDDSFPLKTEAGISTVTVSQVYEKIVDDLMHAIEYMRGYDDRSKDHGYVTTTAAKALLSRVFLYMERNAECIDVCNDLLASAPGQYLTADLPNYYKNARTNPETIWCIAYDQQELEDSFNYNGMDMVGSMYYIPGLEEYGRSGWGEFFWSDPLIELFARYPEDLRFQSFFVQQGKTNDGTKMVHWPIAGRGMDFRTDAVVTNVQMADDGTYPFTYKDVSYTAEKKSKAGVNNGYPQYFINYQGEETQVFVRDNIDADWIYFRTGYVPYMMTKFSGQDGQTNLSSPVILRWAEVILNRAEARAKQGDILGALEDVNMIRRRAGLPDGALMTSANLSERGYDSVLDVVLDERRMEFCFEGQRYFDVYRNKKAMDRRYAGYNQWEVIDYTDDRIPYSIPVNQ